MELYEIIFKLIHVCLFTAGVSFNGLLIFLIFFKTPKAFRPYSILIFNHAATDIVGCFADFFVQARVIPTDWTLAYAVNGVCQYFSAHICGVSFAFQLHSYSHSLYLLLICFTYRYLIIIRKIPSIRLLLFVISIAWIPSIIQTIFFILEICDSKTIGTAVKTRHPYYNFDSGKVFSGYISLFRPLTGSAVFHITMSPTPIYIAILILRNRIIGVLNVSVCHMRDQTKDIHRQLLKALTIQALLPILNLVAVIIFFIGLLDIYDHQILEYCDLVIVQFVPATTPLVSLLYIQPYRKAITKFVTRQLLRRKFDEGSKMASSSYHRETTNNAPDHRVSSIFI